MPLWYWRGNWSLRSAMHTGGEAAQRFVVQSVHEPPVRSQKGCINRCKWFSPPGGRTGGRKHSMGCVSPGCHGVPREDGHSVDFRTAVHQPFPLAPLSLESTDKTDTSARATTTWAGTMTLTSDYTVAAGDTLVIDAGATISFADNVRLYVEGELDVDGIDQSSHHHHHRMPLHTKAFSSTPPAVVEASSTTSTSNMQNGALPSTTATLH